MLGLKLKGNLREKNGGGKRKGRRGRFYSQKKIVKDHYKTIRQAETRWGKKRGGGKQNKSNVKLKGVKLEGFGGCGQSCSTVEQRLRPPSSKHDGLRR